MIPPSLPSHSTENQILAGLDKTDSRYFFSQLERVALPIGQLVYEAKSVLSVGKAWWDYSSLSVLKQRRIESWCTSAVMPCD
jgi:hypothetical protein